MGVLSGIVNFFSGGKIDEELKQFKNVGSETTRKESEYGEGYENPLMAMAGLVSNQFYDKYLYQKLDTKVKK